MTEATHPTAAARHSAGAAQLSAAHSSRGLLAAMAAFTSWGMLPIYFKALPAMSAMEVVAHRVAWSLLFVLGWMALRGSLGSLRTALSRPGVPSRLMASAALISINWLIFVWGVEHGRVVEISLGYFMNPLLNVLLGVVVLSERLTRAQWTAVGFATVAVIHLTLMTGQPPWIALSLAMSFGLYGFIRKTAHVEALPGLAIETTLLTPFAIGYLIWSGMNGASAWVEADGLGRALLVASGPLTAIPLFLFAFGARLIPYSTLGLLQFIAPSLQLLCGVILFDEPFERARAIGFGLIWIALLIYVGDGVWRVHRQRVTAV